MTERVSCQVLVVGLGPVGAALAALLAEAGVRVLAIDKSTEVYPLPRAAHFDHEVMRIFQQLGIADGLDPHTRPVPGEVRVASFVVCAPRIDAQPTPNLPCLGSPTRKPTSGRISSGPARRTSSARRAIFSERFGVAATACDALTTSSYSI